MALVEPITYRCPGCKNHKPSTHADPNHTAGECKWHRRLRAGYGTRKGRHPRAPLHPEIDDVSGEAQALLPDGTDLGQSGEPAPLLTERR